eukprot:5410232-Pleurochrysis_carterae.AAC.1
MNFQAALCCRPRAFSTDQGPCAQCGRRARRRPRRRRRRPASGPSCRRGAGRARGVKGSAS